MFCRICKLWAGGPIFKGPLFRGNIQGLTFGTLLCINARMEGCFQECRETTMQMELTETLLLQLWD